LRLLLDNAVKFSEAGQPVKIHVSSPSPEMISLAVTDQGPGIPREVQGRIFEPFFRWNQENSTHLYSGLGIGLSIAQSIVTRHQGRIEVESEPGRGSTFRILLPLSPKL
jgi:signal transduction histidine kinase